MPIGNNTDDVVLLSPSSYELQKMLDICATYANGHDIKFNTKKTVCMTILPRNFRNLYVPSVTFGGSELKFVDSYKYLGFHLTNKSTRADDMEIHQQYRNLCCRANSVSRKFAMCSYSVKKYLYTTYCSNVSCMHLWHSFHASVLTKFKVCFNNAARMFLGYDKFCSASNMFVQECLPGFDAMHRKSVWNFVSRLSRSSNRIVLSLFFSDLAYTSSIRKAWSKCLYGS